MRVEFASYDSAMKRVGDFGGHENSGRKGLSPAATPCARLWGRSRWRNRFAGSSRRGCPPPATRMARTARIVGMVEKPRLEDAPSNLAIVGRYVLPHDIFGALAYRFDGEHYDVGTPLGMLKASISAALREWLAAEVR